MSTPFSKALSEVIRGYEDAQESSPPSYKCLNFLHQALAMQPNKIAAINEGLVNSLIPLYGIYRSLSQEGTVWVHSDVSLYAGERHEFEVSPDDLTVPCRLMVVKMLKSCLLYLPGRERFLQDFSPSVLVPMLNDPCWLVSAEATAMISCFFSFGDCVPCLTHPYVCDTILPGDIVYTESTSIASVLAQLSFRLLEGSPIVQLAAVELLAKLSQHMPIFWPDLVPGDGTRELTLLLECLYLVAAHTPPASTVTSAAARSRVRNGLTYLRQMQFVDQVMVTLAQLAQGQALVPLLVSLSATVKGETVKLLDCVTIVINLGSASHTGTALVLLSALTTRPEGTHAIAADEPTVSALTSIINANNSDVGAGANLLSHPVSAAMYENAVNVVRAVCKVEAGLSHVASRLMVSPAITSAVLLGKTSARMAAVSFSKYQSQVAQLQAADIARVCEAVPELLSALQLVEVLLSEGQSSAVWGITDIVELLNQLSNHPAPEDDAAGPHPATLLASKCLSVLCRHHVDARAQLAALRSSTATQ